jgi:hypothetical protein
MLMTNGLQTVSVVRSAFDSVWSKIGWQEAEEGVEETERILGIPADRDVKEFLDECKAYIDAVAGKAQAVVAKVDSVITAVTPPSTVTTSTPSASSTPSGSASSASTGTATS